MSAGDSGPQENLDGKEEPGEEGPGGEDGDEDISGEEDEENVDGDSDGQPPEAEGDMEPPLLSGVALLRLGQEFPVDVNGKNVTDAKKVIDAAMDAAETAGGIVVVTGDMGNVGNSSLALGVPVGVTLRWQAQIEGAGSSGVIDISGSNGVFEVAGGGEITVTGNFGRAVYAASNTGGGDINIVVSGGEISATGQSGVAIFASSNIGGDIAIEVSDNAQIMATEQYSSAISANSSNGGDIAIEVSDNAQIMATEQYSSAISANSSNGGDIAIEVSGNAQIMATGQYGMAISANSSNGGGEIHMAVSGGGINATGLGSTAICAYSNNGSGDIAMEISGGEISATEQDSRAIYASSINGGDIAIEVSGNAQIMATEQNGIAIFASSYNGGGDITMEVSGGEISATGQDGFAIYASSNNGGDIAIEVSGNAQIMATEQGGVAISAESSYGGGDITMEVSGGEISATGQDGFAIYASSNNGGDIAIEVSDNAQIMATEQYSVAISAESNNGGGDITMEVSGGEISTTEQNGFAISASSINGSGDIAMEVSGGEITATGRDSVAIKLNCSGTTALNMSGGLVFGIGSFVYDIISGVTPALNGNGVLIAWDQAAAAAHMPYEQGASQDLAFSPVGADVIWGTRNRESGVVYAYKGNSRFLPLGMTRVYDVPGAPENFAASPGDKLVALTWAAPGDSGQAAITHYELALPGEDNWAPTDINHHTVRDLTNGQLYTFQVRAVNRLGPGEPATVSAVPGPSGRNREGGSGGSTATTSVTVRFETGGGSTVKSVTVALNGTLKLPEDPVWQGYLFSGWYTDQALTKPFDSKTAVTHNMTLYAKWEPLDGGEGDEPAQSWAWQNPFRDVLQSHWFYDDVRYVHENGLMMGTGDDAFTPDTPITRGMTGTILWRLAAEPQPTGNTIFTDLSQDWYRDAITWMHETGLAAGYSDSIFGPEDAVTREQLAVMLYNYAGYIGLDTAAVGDLSHYADRDEISGYAREAMAWAVDKGLLTGRSQGELAPTGTATRAEAAAILHRFLEDLARE